jgi:epoxyqueuosine reductase
MSQCCHAVQNHKHSNQENSARILAKAKELGADLAGIVRLSDLKESPSHRLLHVLGDEVDGVRAKPETKPSSAVSWPVNAKSALVAALSHPQDDPLLDWYDSEHSSLGNRRLMRLLEQVGVWAEDKLGGKTYMVSYYVEYGGIYLKDAAVMAGLGCIGKNNLLITPRYGARIRLRALLLDAELEPTRPIDFDPCKGCKEYCRRACPVDAYARPILDSGQTGLAQLPGRDGRFSRSRCMNRLCQQYNGTMGEAAASHPRGQDQSIAKPPQKFVDYCRRCELACPAAKLGRKRANQVRLAP